MKAPFSRRLVTLFLLMMLILAAAPQIATAQATAAQQASCNKLNTAVKMECDNLANEFSSQLAKNNGLPLDLLTTPSDDFFSLLSGIITSAFKNMLQYQADQQLAPFLQSALTDAAQLIATKAAINQTGAVSGASASTNLVTKPTTTGLISLAAESGAFTDTVNGNTFTAQANADGLARYLSGRQFVDLKPNAIDTLRHLNVATTFNVAQSGSTAVATSGSATASTPTIASIILPSNDVSFNSLSVSYSLYRKYDPHSASFSKAWTDALAKAQSDITPAIKAAQTAVSNIQPVLDKVDADPNVVTARNAWIAAAVADETNHPDDFDRLAADYQTYLNVYIKSLLANDKGSTDLLAINSALAALKAVNDKVLDDARGTPLVTLSYTYATPVSKPATHTANFVGSYLFGTDGNKHPFWNGTQLTANVSGSWFNSVPVGATYGSLQSFQFSAEADKPIGSAASPRAIFSLAGYGQYQYTGTVLNITAGNLVPGTTISLPSNAQVLLGVPGWLEVAQAKLVFNIGKGASVPVAFKWSSKTDLVQEGDWKGQFGLTYDLTALTSLLSAKSN